MPSRSFSVLLSVCCLVMLTFSQEKEKEQQLKEFVNVVNIEVLVRVMDKDRPVGGLKKEDFILFAEGRKRQINGFFEVRRRIAQAKIVEPEAPKAPSRLFLLYFWINEPEVKTDEALDYFFRDIYRDNDRVILASSSSVFEINRPEEREPVLERFRAELDAQAETGRKERLAAQSYLARIYDDLNFLMHSSKQINPGARDAFIKQYQQHLREYRLRCLSPHLGRLQSLAASLAEIKADKWALVFLQHERIPVFDPMADRDIAMVNRDIQMPLEVSRIGESLRDLFMQTNTLFHLLTIDSRMTRDFVTSADTADTLAPVIVYSDVYSNWETVLRDITAFTGGRVFNANRLAEALSEAAAAEDIYYLLTFAPEDQSRRERLLEVRVNAPKLHVYYVRKTETQEPGVVVISALSYDPPLLQFTLSGFQRTFEAGRLQGLVKVTLTAVDEEGESVSFERDFTLNETEMAVSLKLNFPHAGKYQLVIQALDAYTGKKATHKWEIEVSQIQGKGVNHAQEITDADSVTGPAAASGAAKPGRGQGIRPCGQRRNGGAGNGEGQTGGRAEKR